jgi:hypothetical protein
VLDEPLKSVGDFKVAIKLFREVIANIKVTVVADAPEAGEVPAAEPVAEAPAAEAPAAE